jgi:hypothetical protein
MPTKHGNNAILETMRTGNAVVGVARQRKTEANNTVVV